MNLTEILSSRVDELLARRQELETEVASPAEGRVTLRLSRHGAELQY